MGQFKFQNLILSIFLVFIKHKGAWLVICQVCRWACYSFWVLMEFCIL